MEFIPVDSIKDWISDKLGLDKLSPGNIVNNMGVMLILGGVILAFVFFLGVLWLLTLCNYSLYKQYRRLKSKILYNAFLRYLLTAILKLMTAAATSLTLTEDVTGAWASITILAVLSLTPVFSAVLLFKNRKKLSLPSMNEKIGSLYAGCKHGENEKWQLALSTIFLLRRIFFVSLTYCIPALPCVQVFIFL
jgi:hypothetical protein